MHRIMRTVEESRTTNRPGVSEPYRVVLSPPSVKPGLTDPATTTPAPTIPATTTPAPTTPAPTTSAPTIRFSHLTFAYGDRQPALRDVSFEVAPGQTVAGAGATVSGKSTLCLLPAPPWYPPPRT